MSHKFSPLFERIGITVPDSKISLFEEAFTHRSVLNESRTTNNHNERLEFLGDAVLELATTEFLFLNFDCPEGDLTSYRSALVKRDTLAQVARKLDLGAFLYLSKGEARSGGHEKDYLLANTVESFIGALYLGLGMKAASEFIHTFILSELPDILKEGSHIDAKSQFQEFTQAAFGITPHYEVLSEEGLDHEKQFSMGTMLSKTQVGQGVGRSKKEAQIAAAQNALDTQPDWESQFQKK